ncbi:hypothetical protein Tco_0008642 [Tanacetum coccineum]
MIIQTFSTTSKPQYETYSCELCGNDSHYSYDCPPQFPLVYEQEPSYNQNFGDNYYPQNSLSSQQQYLCYENYGGPHETFQCQPLNQNFYEPNLCYNSIASSFDQFQPPQFPVIHQPPQEMSIQDMGDLKQQYLDKMKSLINEFPIKDYRDEKIDIKINELKENFNGMSIEINKKKKLQQLEQYTIAITPVLPTEEPDNSLSMGDEHLSTIPEMESDELIKSNVENLVPIPSESEDFSDIEIDSLLEEFFGELAHINLIPPGINEADFDPEEEIRLVEKLLIDENDSKGDILFLEELLSNDSPLLHENKSFHFDVLSSPRPPAKLPDDRIYFKPDTGVLTAKVVGDISELYLHVPNFLPTFTNLSPMFNTLLPFSSENGDKVFNHGILASNEEKSPHLLSHQGFNPSKIISDFSESPMMISGGDIPILDVPIAPDFEASRAHGFVLRSLELQSLA